ncbi:MAG: hypothetical protein DKINENOH_04822 [bacterium]|nr:hypothetical protein [bacterium]
MKKTFTARGKAVWTRPGKVWRPLCLAAILPVFSLRFCLPRVGSPASGNAGLPQDGIFPCCRNEYQHVAPMIT